MFNNNKLVISSYKFKSRKIQDSIRIVHLSDLHEKNFGENNQQLFSAVRTLCPDIIAVTGDLSARVAQKEVNIHYTKNLGQGLCKIAPVYFVSGNHEKNHLESIQKHLMDAGVRMASENLYCLHIRKNSINISGMHDVSITNEYEKRIKALENLEGYSVFLSHRPDFIKICSHHNIDLVLCGHTHAGQVRFPFIGTFYMFGQGMFPTYVQGQFICGNTTMIISRGLGSSGYPTIRINNPPEIVFITIESEK